MLKRKREDYSSQIGKFYPELGMAKCVTFQVTDDCQLACTYCYQHNKGHHKMSFETAKQVIDMIISGEKGMKEYLDYDHTGGLIFEFIGGEPFLEIELIDQICEYYLTRAIETNFRYAETTRFSFSSNGVSYFDPKVQKYLNKYRQYISLGITVDGNKTLHDKCRIFPDGRGSYTLAHAAADDLIKKGYDPGSKITISPENLDYLYDAFKSFVDDGNTEINANTVFEDVWTFEDARKYYKQLIKIADYIVENNLEETIYFSRFNDMWYKPQSEEENHNWCGGDSSMIAVDYQGIFYPCQRYMATSLGKNIKPLIVGNLKDGIGQTEETKQVIANLKALTRRSQSTDECFYCPVSAGCAWCSAYNYEVFGTPNKRATFICDMHKAEAVANAYYYDMLYFKGKYDHIIEVKLDSDYVTKLIE